MPLKRRSVGRANRGGAAASAGRLAAGLVAFAIAGAACSVPTTSSPRHVTTPQRTYAMTGLPADEGSAAKPVVTVKIDNTPAGQPQRGVNSADLVIEEPVEGGLTRLAAFFESRLPETVGPVRSARISDIGMVKPVRATVVASGGAPPTLTAFRQAGVRLLTEGDDGFVRDPDRPMPENLFVDLTRVDRARAGAVPTQPYFDFGQPQLPAAPTADRITIVYSPSHSEDWRWDAKSGSWSRTDILDGSITTPTIIVCSVALADAGYRDAAGSRVPIVQTTGRGNAFLLVNGHVHPIAWRKDADTSPWEFSTRAGLVIPVPPGRVWLALIQRGSGGLRF